MTAPSFSLPGITRRVITSDSRESIRFSSPHRIGEADRLLLLAVKVGAAEIQTSCRARRRT